MQKCLAITIVLMLIALHGCAYTHIRRPLDTNFDRTTLGTKVGKSQSHSVAWIIAWGDAGTQAAAMEGGLKVINHADIEITILLFGLYTRVSTIAYGM